MVVIMVEKIIMQDNEVVFCKRCNRRLRDIDAKKLGYGKVCYNKIKTKNSCYLFKIEGVDIEHR